MREHALDIDDIECDLDEDLDDERCSIAKKEAAAAAPHSIDRRQSHNVNDSFIFHKLRDFSCIKPQSLARQMNLSNIGSTRGRTQTVSKFEGHQPEHKKSSSFVIVNHPENST